MTAGQVVPPDLPRRPISGDPADAKPVLTAAEVARAVDRMAHELLEKTGGGTDVVLLGIPTRGTTLAARLADRIEAFEGLQVPTGSLDITLYRDDLRLKSQGRWKAVVVGSYERGDRAVTVQRLAELADFYGVPVSELLPEGVAVAAAEPAAKIIIDLEQLQGVPADKAAPLARYAATIQSQRGDYNGKVLSIRTEDLRSLAIIYDMSPGDLTEQLIGWGVLPPEARPVKDKEEA